MADKSGIEWTDATWNPVTGCTKISAGCDNCYAETFAERWRGIPGHPYEQGFDLKLHPSRLDQPLKWKKPRKIFVNSMSDLFHKDISNEFRDKVFAVMEKAKWHTFQVLTKRSSLMRDYINARYGDEGECPEHIWLGVSVENKQAKSRILHLHDTNAEMKFLSLEPLLEDLGELLLIETNPYHNSMIRWVIVGGESGANARPIEEGWIKNILYQCQIYSIAFMFKQWGGKTSKTGGRELDGKIYNEYPEIKNEESFL